MNPLHVNGFEYQPTKNLNRYLREYGVVCLSDTTPAPPEGMDNINWQTDSQGNISAWVEPGGGGGGVSKIIAGTNVTISPTEGTGDVTISSTGGTVNLLPLGAYQSGQLYNANDVVSENGNSYLSRVNSNVGNDPATSPTQWQLFAAQGEQGPAGDGGVVAGTQFQVPNYTADGLSVQSTAMTIKPGPTPNASLLNAFLPGSLVLGQPFSNQFTIPGTQNNGTFDWQSAFGFVNSLQNNQTIVGTGMSLGGSGGWTVGVMNDGHYQVNTRGIHQTNGSLIEKHAVGDTAANYHYLYSDGGGLTASSDEGETLLTTEHFERSFYYRGTVSSTTGRGDQAPVWSQSTGGSNNWHTDGTFMLNISRPVVTTHMQSQGPTPPVFTINGTATPSYFRSLTCTATTIPISTGIGYGFVPNWSSAVTYVLNEVVFATDGNYYQSVITSNTNHDPVSSSGFWLYLGTGMYQIPNPGCTADSPISTTFSIKLVTFNGSTPQFNVGDHVSVAGSWYPEQSILTAASTPVGGVQKVTCLLRNPNAQVSLFKGGVAGCYISMDASYAFSNMRSSYYAFGSLDGTNLIYGMNLEGDISFQSIPQAGAEYAIADGGAFSQITIYPGAEVVRNPVFQSPNATLEQNNVLWTAGDVIENPHSPTTGGVGIWLVEGISSPTSTGHGRSAFSANMFGAGWSGRSSMISLTNQNPENYYSWAGGNLGLNYTMEVNGPNNGFVTLTNAPPASTPLIHIQGQADPNNTGPLPGITILQFNYQANGNFFFEPAIGRWGFQGDVLGQNFWTNQSGTIFKGTSGTFTSADGKTITVWGGLITSIV